MPATRIIELAKSAGSDFWKNIPVQIGAYLARYSKKKAVANWLATAFLKIQNGLVVIIVLEKFAVTIQCLVFQHFSIVLLRDDKTLFFECLTGFS